MTDTNANTALWEAPRVVIGTSGKPFTKAGGSFVTGSVRTSCRNCGRPINVKPKHIKNGRGRFCGRECSDAAKRSGWKNRLWWNIDKSGGAEACWPWRGSFFSNGYPQFAIEQKTVRAHRVVAELCLGPIPEGWVVCHRCDNPKCCNPLHLFIGTSEANAHDRDAKGRTSRKLGAPRDDHGRFVNVR